MSFNYQGAFIGPFSVAVGRGQNGELQKFRYPFPATRTHEHFFQALFMIEGRVEMRWSNGAPSVKELGVGGSFTEDDPKDRPKAVDEELTIKSIGDSAYVCVSPVGVEQKVRMHRTVLQPGESLEVPRHELAVTADSPYPVRVDGRQLAAGPRFFYGRTREFRLSADGPVACAVFSMLG